MKGRAGGGGVVVCVCVCVRCGWKYVDARR
jgi:hypothetical protein